MLHRRAFAAGAALAPMLAACGQPFPAPVASVSSRQFGETPDGPANIYTLANAHGLSAAITNYGAILMSLKTPDRAGAVADVVLGYADLAGYVSDPSFRGATIGRYANRIAGARFTLNGTAYPLAANNGPNTLHGGARGFHKYLWAATTATDPSGASVMLTRTSPDGEEGFPGALDVTVAYTLTNSNELIIEYSATTDKPTPICLTNHAYWNLAGEGEGDILAHTLTIAADAYLPVDATLIPTGEFAPVQNTPFDFRNATAIGARIGADNEQLRRGIGYDHNWVLDGGVTETARAVARLEHPASGRVMTISTTEPGLQFYSGNHLNGALGKSGKPYLHRGALCLETQHFPDSPNQPDFPSVILNPGETYASRTIHAFSVV